MKTSLGQKANEIGIFCGRSVFCSNCAIMTCIAQTRYVDKLSLDLKAIFKHSIPMVGC